MKYFLDKELQREVQIKELDGVKSVFEGNILVGSLEQTHVYADCPDERMELAMRLQEFIEKKGVTKMVLSNTTNISRSNIDNYLKGTTTIGLAQLIRLGDVLGFKVVLESVN